MESFEAERTHPGIPAVVRPWREIGMGRLRRPRPVRPNLSLQEIPRGLRARVIAVAEADHHPRRVADEAEVGLAAASGEGSVRPAIVLEHQLDTAADPRMMDGQAEVREREEAPVRRHVLRSVQRLAVDPEPARVLYT